MSIFAKAPKKLSKDDGILVGKGFALKDRKNREVKNIVTEFGNRLNHTFVFGTTGVGKTRLLENMIEQNILGGANVVIIDPKGDIDLFSKTVQLAHEAGREKELLFLSPVYHQYSVSINPLKNFFLEDEIIAHVMSCVPPDDEFFYNVAYETTTAIVKLLLVIRRLNKDTKPLTFGEISGYVSYNDIKKLYENYLQNNVIIEKCRQQGEREIDKIANLFEQILGSPVDYFSKISSTLRGALTRMTTGNLALVMGGQTENVFIDRLEADEGVIFYIQTNSMLTNLVSSAISKVSISMIQTLVGRLNASGKRFSRCLNIYIDEMASSVYMGIETLYAQARSTNVAIVGLTQSFADIVSEIGADRAKKLFDLTSTKIIMRMNDVNSANMISDIGGVEKLYTSMFNANGGITTREVEEDVVKAEDVMRLQKREFYYFGFEGQFKGKTAPVSPAYWRVKMPDITTV